MIQRDLHELINKKDIMPLELTTIEHTPLVNGSTGHVYTLLFAYKKRQIKLEITIRDSGISYYKNVPTTNNKVNDVIYSLIEDITTFIRNESELRMKVVFQLEQPRIGGFQYNPLLTKIEDILPIVFFYSFLLSIPVLLGVFLYLGLGVGATTVLLWSLLVICFFHFAWAFFVYSSTSEMSGYVLKLKRIMSSYIVLFSVLSLVLVFKFVMKFPSWF